MNYLKSVCETLAYVTNQNLSIVYKEGMYILQRKEKGGNTINLISANTEEQMLEHLDLKYRNADRKRINAEVRLGIHQRFQTHCKEHKVSMTNTLERLMVEYLTQAG